MKCRKLAVVQVSVRDFIPSAQADIVKNLFKTLHLQGHVKKIDKFTLGEGVIEEKRERVPETLEVDYGGIVIGRDAPIDSGFWWIILLESYVRWRDYSRVDMLEVWRGTKLKLNLCLPDGIVTLTSQLYAYACCRINRRMDFVRDLFSSALARLMKKPPEADIVKNFLLELHLQGRKKKIDNYTLGEGVMPTRFKVKNNEKCGTIILCVAALDSGFWWIILLKSYVKCTRDYSLVEMPEVQCHIKYILNTSPSLLCAYLCCMIDRWMFAKRERGKGTRHYCNNFGAMLPHECVQPNIDKPGLSRLFCISAVKIKGNQLLYQIDRRDEWSTLDYSVTSRLSYAPGDNLAKNQGLIQENELDSELDFTLEEHTCHTLDFLNILKDRGINFEAATGVKVGIIDFGRSIKQPLADEFNAFSRVAPLKFIHGSTCKDLVSMGSHGYFCASILGGKMRDVNYFGLGDGKKIRGVVPSADLHMYGFSCDTCRKKKNGTSNFILQALNEVVNDHIRILSVSLGAPENPSKDDQFGHKTLELFKANVFTVVSAGNSGPNKGTIENAMPWCLTVGACTSKKTLRALIEIGTKDGVPVDIKILRTVLDEGEEINILSEFEGVAVNILEIGFRELRLDSKSAGQVRAILGYWPNSNSNKFHLVAANSHPYFEDGLQIFSYGIFVSISGKQCEEFFLSPFV